MRVWHQSFTDLSRMPVYRRTLEEYAAKVMGDRGEVAVHGLRPGTYGEEFTPIDAIKYRYLEVLNEDQLCEAALTARGLRRDGDARGRRRVEGATVMDSMAVLFAYAEMLVRLRRTAGMTASRRQSYLKPPPDMLRFARDFAGRAHLGEADFSGSGAG